MGQEVLIDDFVFVGHATPPLVASPDSGPWRRAIVGAAPPTVAGAAGGMALSLTATNEAQNACLYMGDVLNYDIDDLIQADFWVQLTAAFAAANTLSFGLASARNNDPEAIAAAALFKCVGNNNVVISTDDAVIDKCDQATGETLVATMKRFTIDFGSGVQTLAAPSLSKGGKANVQFLCDNGRGQLRNLARNVLFDMSNYTGGLQPFAQIQKTAGVTTGAATIARIRIKRRLG